MAPRGILPHPSAVAHPHTPARPASAAGRWFLAGIGLSLALVGAIFCWLMWGSYQRARVMHSWPEVPCVILLSDVEERRIDPDSHPEFRVNVVYGYQWQGQKRTGDRITARGNPWTSKTNVIQARALEFASGATTTCRVDPQNPDFAVLKPDSKAAGYSIWFPGLFVGGGLVMIWRAFRRPPPLRKY
jgi:hypothetical protein